MPVIEVEGLVKTYGGTNVVDEISFSVEGELFGIIGLNRAGKTTAVDSVEGPRARASDPWRRRLTPRAVS